MKTRFGAVSAAIFMLVIVPAAMAAPEATKAPAAGAIIWKQQFGTAQAEGISRLAADGSGNIIAYGSTAGTLREANKGGTDVFVAKYSPAGAQTWVHQLGSAQNDKPIGLAVSSTGEIVIAGSNPTQWFLAKYNSGGALQWQRTFTTAAPGAIALASGGQIVSVTAAGDFLEQYSSTGALVWHKSITAAEFSGACCLAIDRSGNIIVGGSYQLLVGNVAKFSAAGSLIWHHDFGGFEEANCTGVATDADGNVIAVGRANVTNAYGVYDHFDVMAKWSPAGVHPIGDINQPLTAYIQTNGSGGPTGVAVNAAGDIFISGSATVYSQSGSDAVVTALGGDSTERWRAIYGTAGKDLANAIAVGPDGALYVGGWTNGALGAPQKGGGDAFLLKLSPQ